MSRGDKKYATFVGMAKQYAPLQDLMLKQTGSSSVNILRQMLDLFSATQALINEMPSSMDPSSLMMLSVQLIDTICECLMGPNIKHQKELLNSNFFFDINRIFSSYYYVGGEPGHLKDAWDIKSHHNTDSSNNISEEANESKMNQLRYVLKASALKACLSMFDTVTHTHSGGDARLLGRAQSRFADRFYIAAPWLREPTAESCVISQHA